MQNFSQLEPQVLIGKACMKFSLTLPHYELLRIQNISVSCTDKETFLKMNIQLFNCWLQKAAVLTSTYATSIFPTTIAALLSKLH